MLALTIKKLDAFKFDGVTESDNTGDSYNAQQQIKQQLSGSTTKQCTCQPKW